MIFESHNFVEIDVVLRRGGHINRSDLSQYQFICDHYQELQAFYTRYGCNLVQHPDGFFYLLSNGGILPTRLMPKTCVHLGMFIALKMRDPEITKSSGKLTVDQLLQAIETSISLETLQRVYAPKQREASQYEKIREEIIKALRILEQLQFVRLKDHVIRPMEAINRFADLARHDNDPDQVARAALLVQRGVVFSIPSEVAESGGESQEMGADIESENQ